MNIVEFLRTIYVGDRALKALVIDGWNSEVKLQVTSISRIRSITWGNYIDEDLIDGFIVFEGVTSVQIEPAGVIPNDSINDIRVEALFQDEAQYLIVVSADSINDIGDRVEVEIRIRAEAMSLEMAGQPGKRITK